MNGIASHLTSGMQNLSINKSNNAPSSGSDRIEIQLRIPDQLMAKQIMDKTIALLEKTAQETTDSAERVQALECIELIKRDNPQLVALGKPGF